jgi:hypothetical protein
VALLASGAVLAVLLGQSEEPASTALLRGNVGLCTELEGDAARECYAREVGRELAAVGGTPQPVFAAPADGTAGTVTFANAASTDTSAALLCDLHLRAGVTDESKPNWTSWAAQ